LISSDISKAGSSMQRVESPGELRNNSHANGEQYAKSQGKSPPQPFPCRSWIKLATLIKLLKFSTPLRRPFPHFPLQQRVGGWPSRILLSTKDFGGRKFSFKKPKNRLVKSKKFKRGKELCPTALQRRRSYERMWRSRWASSLIPESPARLSLMRTEFWRAS